MKIVIATDSYKGSATSMEVAYAIEKGIRSVFPDAEIVKVPVADGGEGTVEAVVGGAGGTLRKVNVEGPLGEQVQAEYGIVQKTAVIEMAAASGLMLVPENQRNPMLTSTFGTGQLIRAALDQGVEKIIVGIGGSATNDAGVGMAQALGISFRDQKGMEISRGGGNLGGIREIDFSNRDPMLDEIEITIACDVTNPLYGQIGASHVYGPQKGADAQMVQILDGNLKHLAELVEKFTGRDMASTEGAGAAGGLGYGLMVFCGAAARSGIDTILDAVGIDAFLENADLVITGEGRIDCQSAFGKVPVGVAAKAQKHMVPVLAIVGSIGSGAAEVYSHGIDGMESTVDRPMILDEALTGASDRIASATIRAMRMVRIGMLISSH
jgi:glycerate kinase